MSCSKRNMLYRKLRTAISSIMEEDLRWGRCSIRLEEIKVIILSPREDWLFEET